jgi:hypothetical protein
VPLHKPTVAVCQGKLVSGLFRPVTNTLGTDGWVMSGVTCCGYLSRSRKRALKHGQNRKLLAKQAKMMEMCVVNIRQFYTRSVGKM